MKTRGMLAKEQKEKEISKSLKKRKYEVLQEATTQYQREIEKENFQFSSPKKSARTIAKAVGEKHGTEVCHQSILDNIKKDVVIPRYVWSSKFGIYRDNKVSTTIKDNNESKIDALKKEKKKRVEMARIDTAARELLKRKIAPDNLKKDHLELLLRWRGIPKKDMPKTNRKRLQKWLEVKDDSPPIITEWTLEEEAKIAKLESPDKEHVPFAMADELLSKFCEIFWQDPEDPFFDTKYRDV